MTDTLDPRTIGPDPRALGPWTSDGVVRLVAGNAAGVILILVSWYQTSGQASVRTGMSWLELGIAGLAVTAFADAVWLLRGRASINAAARVVFDTAPVPTTGVAHTEPARLAWVRGTKRYHDVHCHLIDGKTVTMTTAAQRRGLEPCEVCLDE